MFLGPLLGPTVSVEQCSADKPRLQNLIYPERWKNIFGKIKSAIDNKMITPLTSDLAFDPDI